MQFIFDAILLHWAVFMIPACPPNLRGCQPVAIQYGQYMLQKQATAGLLKARGHYPATTQWRVISGTYFGGTPGKYDFSK